MEIQVGDTFVKEIETDSGFVLRRSYPVKRVGSKFVTIETPEGELRRKVKEHFGYNSQYYIELNRDISAYLDQRAPQRKIS